MENKLPYVISDLDGTLVSVGYEMSKDTIRDVLKYQKASGNKFSFATGRTDYMCRPFVEWLDITNPVISCNGAIIRDPRTDEVLYADYVDSKIVAACYKKAAKLGLDICGYDENNVICLKTSNEYKNWSNVNKTIDKEEWKVPFKIYPDYESIIKDIEDGKIHMLKMMIDDNSTHREKDAESVFEEFKDELNYTWSGNNYLDAMNKDVSKASGLRHLAEILKVNVKDIVCFGDNFNDIEMIEEVNHGYAIGNAVQPLKDIAYKTVDTLENNGVGKMLLDIIDNKY